MVAKVLHSSYVVTKLRRTDLRRREPFERIELEQFRHLWVEQSRVEWSI